MFIKVMVTVDACVEKVVKESDDFYLVFVREKAERSEANKRVLEIFRKLYPRKSIKIVKGQMKQRKMLEII